MVEVFDNIILKLQPVILQNKFYRSKASRIIIKISTSLNMSSLPAIESKSPSSSCPSSPSSSGGNSLSPVGSMFPPSPPIDNNGLFESPSMLLAAYNGIHSVNLMFQSRDVIGAMKILNDTIGKTTKRLTGMANIIVLGKNDESVEVRMALEGSLLVLLSVLEGVQEHEDSRLFEVQKKGGKLESMMERFYPDFTLHMPFAVQKGQCGEDDSALDRNGRRGKLLTSEVIKMDYWLRQQSLIPDPRKEEVLANQNHMLKVSCGHEDIIKIARPEASGRRRRSSPLGGVRKLVMG